MGEIGLQTRRRELSEATLRKTPDRRAHLVAAEIVEDRVARTSSV